MRILLIISTLAISMVVGNLATAEETRVTSDFRGKAVHTRTMVLERGQFALVSAEGDHSTDLDLYVEGPEGEKVAKDEDETDTCLVKFTAMSTGTFRVHVVNRDDAPNQYDFRTFTPTMRGKLVVHNSMDIAAKLRVNGLLWRIPAHAERFEVLIPAGRLKTELVDHESAKRWSVSDDETFALGLTYRSRGDEVLTTATSVASNPRR